MDNKVTSREDFIQEHFGISAEELDKRSVCPNLDIWMTTKMSYFQLMRLIKSSPILKNENVFNRHYVAYLQLLGFYDRRRCDQMSVERAQSFIHDYLEEQLEENEISFTMYSLEDMLHKDIMHSGGQMMFNKLCNIFETDGMTMSGISFIIHNDPFVMHLFERFTDGFRNLLKLTDGKLFILEDELLYSAIISNAMTQRQLRFMMDFVIGHERAHVVSGSIMNPHEWIAKNWKGGYTVYGVSGIQEQMADREGFIYAIKQMRKRRKEYIANLY